MMEIKKNNRLISIKIIPIKKKVLKLYISNLFSDISF